VLNKLFMLVESLSLILSLCAGRSPQTGRRQLMQVLKARPVWTFEGGSRTRQLPPNSINKLLFRSGERIDRAVFDASNGGFEGSLAVSRNLNGGVVSNAQPFILEG
jgi:hypothetical protein